MSLPVYTHAHQAPPYLAGCHVLSEEGYEVGGYDEASIRYLGKSNPSKSFRMLQDLTGGDSLQPPARKRPQGRGR